MLLASLCLLLVDALITTGGIRRGIQELNPVLRRILRRFGLIGFVVSRVLAVVCLLILFGILDEWSWMLFSTIFSVIMAMVVVVGLRRTIGDKSETRRGGAVKPR